MNCLLLAIGAIMCIPPWGIIFGISNTSWGLVGLSIQIVGLFLEGLAI